MEENITSSEISELIEKLNKSEPNKLIPRLKEMDDKIKEIISRGGGGTSEKVYNAIRKNRSTEFFVWLCFLRAIFLRGKDTLSGKAFNRFIEYAEKDNYYFDKFPDRDKIIDYELKWRYTEAVEKILRQIRKEYKSGKEFIEGIKMIANSYSEEEIDLLYLHLISEFSKFKYIGNKIANAIVNEIKWTNEISTIQKEISDEYLKNGWFKKIIYASYFNVMIDVHVINFFKEQGFKGVDMGYLVLLGSRLDKKITESLFKYEYELFNVNYDKVKNYHPFIAANLIEKIIWRIGFYKKNKKKDEPDFNLF